MRKWIVIVLIILTLILLIVETWGERSNIESSYHTPESCINIDTEGGSTCRAWDSSRQRCYDGYMSREKYTYCVRNDIGEYNYPFYIQLFQYVFIIVALICSFFLLK